MRPDRVVTRGAGCCSVLFGSVVVDFGLRVTFVRGLASAFVDASSSCPGLGQSLISGGAV